MTISYIDSYYATGLSTDAKPLNVPIGFRLLEIDSGKLKYWDGDSWNDIEGGTTGTWNPFAVEELKNKTVTLNLNTVRTSSGTLGLFAFNNTGSFIFVPIGSANRYLKVNSAATGFEFGDPATTGAWDPNATETITNKTIVAENNSIKSSTPVAGKMLLDNGTKYVSVAKGSIGQAWKVKSDGTVGWDTDATGAAGAGSSLPSAIGYKQGWYDGGSYFDNYAPDARGLLQNELYYEYYTGDYPSMLNSTTRGKYINMPISISSSYQQFKSNYIFMRNFSSYMLVKFKLASTVNANTFIGFTSYMPAQFSAPSVFNNYDNFVFGKHTTYSNWRILHNSATTTVTNDDTGIPYNTNAHTIELQADPANNRFQWRLDDFGGTWNNVSSSIPRTDSTMGLFVSINGYTTGANALELYLLEAANKVMF